MPKIRDVYNELMEVKAKLIEANNQASFAKKRYEEVMEEMVSEMQIIGTTQFKGAKGLVYTQTKMIPIMEDWDELTNWIVKHDAFDLLEKRVSRTAWRDRIEEGNIPGLGAMQQVKLVVNMKED